MRREDEFRTYLRRSGRSASATDRCVAAVAAYQDWLGGRDEQDVEALVEYVTDIESVPKSSAKLQLWALAYYFDFTGHAELGDLSRTMRSERIDRKPFALRDFRGIDPLTADRLARVGVTDVEHMRRRGRAAADREALADEGGIPVEKVEEVARLSDLARIPGVKGIRARLYYEAGIRSVPELAAWDPADLRDYLVRFCEESGFEGMAPLPAEAEHAVATARGLLAGLDE